MDDLVLLFRLPPAMVMADAMDLCGRLSEYGISAVPEATPGAALDTVTTFLIKVPAAQYKEAQAALEKILPEL